MKRLRPKHAVRAFGYLVYGLFWLSATLIMLVIALFIVFGPIGDYRINGDTLGNPWPFVFGIPMSTVVFVIAPWLMFSQAMLGFVFAGQALSRAHRNRQISHVIGSDSGGVFEALIDTPSTRLWTAVGSIAFVPGWQFAGSGLVLVIGICLARFVDSPVVALVGWILMAAGAGVSVFAILPRLQYRAPLSTSTNRNDPEARAKRRADAAYREGKRARELRKARDEGQAPGAKEGPSPTPFERWGAAEAETALRQHSLASRDARLGVPGALDAAIEAVTSAMYWHITSEEAERFVIDAAAYRGKKPVRVKLTPGAQYTPTVRKRTAR